MRPMNLLVTFADSGRSSNSVVNRMNDRNFAAIDFIRVALKSRRDASRRGSRQVSIVYLVVAFNYIGRFYKNLTRKLDLTPLQYLSNEVMVSLKRPEERGVGTDWAVR